MVFIPQAQPHAQSLFLFPIVFGINLIHFFDIFDDKEERCSRKFDRLLCCFDRLSITPCDSAKYETVSKSATFLATESVNSAPFKRRKTEVQIFWQGKAQNSSPILRCTFLARSAKLIANLTVQSLPKVKSLPHFFCMIQWVDCSNFSQTERLCTKIFIPFAELKNSVYSA